MVGYTLPAWMKQGKIRSQANFRDGDPHFWRYKPSADHWQHLFAAPEGLIAVSGVGRFVYALGYWGHILYQYDTHTRESRQIRVGSEGGHISRNLIQTVTVMSTYQR